MNGRRLEYLYFGWRLLKGVHARHEQAFADARERDVAPYLPRDCSWRVLDLANGRLRPQYTLLRAAGHEVYGIDLVNGMRGGWVDLAYGFARRLYAFKLGVPADVAGTGALLCADAAALPFADGSFDLVTSVAAFEHFLDVPAVTAELHRVVRPEGLIWIVIHLFTSPSGAHNLNRAEVPLRTIPRGVEPWDHLRRRRLPVAVPLNEWRRNQYLEAVERHFRILSHYCILREGEQFLTPELERELAGYSRDELTAQSYVIVARKPLWNAG